VGKQGADGAEAAGEGGVGGGAVGYACLGGGEEGEFGGGEVDCVGEAGGWGPVSDGGAGGIERILEWSKGDVGL